MKWAFLLGSPHISGGTYVIFEHAIRNQKKGVDVYVITETPVTKEDISWHKDAGVLKFITYEEAEDIEFDFVIATWWRTVYEIHRVKAKNYLYFVQSIESKFYPEAEKSLRWLVEATYTLPLGIITEATWIKNYLEDKYGREVQLVHNGIRKDVYTTKGEAYEKCDGLRVLVEGPVDVAFKNVPKTIELAKKSKADEIWLLTSSDVKEYPGIDRLFSRVPIYDVPKIYRSCDVIVKLSYVEGMFGPPLEMFHCGGTAITYTVTGYDEYLKHGYNSLIANTDDEEKVIEYINTLKDKPKKLKELKKNALQTADEWIDWAESSKRFHKAVLNLRKDNALKQTALRNQSKHLFEAYVNYEQKDIAFKKYMLKKVQEKTPIIYKIYRGTKMFILGIFRRK